MVWKWRRLDHCSAEVEALSPWSLWVSCQIFLHFDIVLMPPTCPFHSLQSIGQYCVIGPDCMDSSVLYILGFVSLDTTMPVFYAVIVITVVVLCIVPIYACLLHFWQLHSVCEGWCLQWFCVNCDSCSINVCASKCALALVFLILLILRHSECLVSD